MADPIFTASDAALGTGGLVGVAALWRWIERTWKTDRRSDAVDTETAKLIENLKTQIKAADERADRERDRADKLADDLHETEHQKSELAGEVRELRGRVTQLESQVRMLTKANTTLLRTIALHQGIPPEMLGLPSEIDGNVEKASHN